MKNHFKISIGCIFLSLLMIYACSKDQDEINIDDSSSTEKTILTKENQFEDLFKFPIGTELWIENGALNFNLPKGYVLALRSAKTDGSQKAAIGIGSGSVRCKCTEGSGCSPFTMGGQSGCSTTNNSCKNCQMSTGSSISIAGARSNENFEFDDAEIINLSADMEFLIDADKILSTPSPKGFIFEIPEVQEKILDFMKGYGDEADREILSKNNTTELPEGYRYTPVKFSNTLVFLPLSLKKSVSAALADISISDGGHSCTCHQGSGCKKGSKWTPAGTLRYCDAGSCTDCELTN